MPPFIRKRRGWDWFSPREIRHLPFEQRTHLAREAQTAAQRHWTFCVVSMLGPLVGFAPCCVLNVSSALMPQFALVVQTLWLVAFVAGVIGVFWYQRRLYKRALRQTLEQRGIAPAVCFDCGYDVEGFTGAECPVCGTVLVPHPLPPPPDAPAA